MRALGANLNHSRGIVSAWTSLAGLESHARTSSCQMEGSETHDEALDIYIYIIRR